MSTQFGLTIKAVQCDNGREFDNSTSRSFFLSRGVPLRMSCPYTSPQNGKAERMLRTTNDFVRTFLIQASLPPRFWAEGLHTATYLFNRLPSTASPAPTPHHALFSTPPCNDHLRVFGCACYPNIFATASHKLAPRSTRCVFLGYSPDHKGYRCFDHTTRRILISRHVVFDKSDFLYSTSRSFFLSRGVQLRMSCPYTSPQNGKTERMIRTTNDVVRTLLIQASLPPRFWAESLHTTTYLLNRLPSTASPAPTPHHALFGTPPRYDHLRVCVLP